MNKFKSENKSKGWYWITVGINWYCTNFPVNARREYSGYGTGRLWCGTV